MLSHSLRNFWQRPLNYLKWILAWMGVIIGGLVSIVVIVGATIATVILGRLRRRNLGGRAMSKSDEKQGEYRKVPNEEIEEAEEYGSQRVPWMIFANSRLEGAKKQAAGKEDHTPSFHDSGWSIALDTSWGVVGLWSCWLENKFYLGYPKRTRFLVSKLPRKRVEELANDFKQEHPNQFTLPSKQVDFKKAKLILISLDQEELIDFLRQKGVEVPSVNRRVEIPDEVVMQTLDVKPAEPVSDDGFGTRKWGDFYGPQLPDNRGRVWIHHDAFYSDERDFPIISPEGKFKEVVYGHHYARGVWTEEFSFFSETQPEAPNAESEVIQGYRDKFLDLAIEIAGCMGRIEAVDIDYNFVLVPEQLERIGYENITWLKGKPGIRKGWGNEIVRAERNLGDNKEIIILKSGNKIVPWKTIRRVPVTSELGTDDLLDLLTF